MIKDFGIGAVKRVTLMLLFSCGSSQAAPTSTSTAAPTGAEPHAQTVWTALVAGPTSTCVWSVGRAPQCYGELEGLREDDNRPAPTELSEVGPVDQLVIGEGACSIAAGRLRCFNNATPLLPEDEQDDFVPVVDIASDALRVAVGVHYACYVARDNSAACWRTGDVEGEEPGPLGVQPVGNGVLQFVAELDIRCRVTTDHALECMGSSTGRPAGDRPWTPVPGVGPVVEVRLMRGSVCALEVSGGVVCFAHQQTIEGARDDATIYSEEQLALRGLGATAIATAEEHGCALADGEVWCWGSSAEGQLGVEDDDARDEVVHVTQLSGASAIAVGVAHTCALVEGTLRCVGSTALGAFPPTAFAR